MRKFFLATLVSIGVIFGCCGCSSNPAGEIELIIEDLDSTASVGYLTYRYPSTWSNESVDNMIQQSSNYGARIRATYFSDVVFDESTISGFLDALTSQGGTSGDLKSFTVNGHPAKRVEVKFYDDGVPLYGEAIFIYYDNDLAILLFATTEDAIVEYSKTKGGVIASIKIAKPNSSDSQDVENAPVRPEPNQEPTSKPEPVIQTIFSAVLDVEENGVVYLDYKINCNKYSYFNKGDADKQNLAKEIFDDALTIAGSKYPNSDNLSILVQTNDSNMAMVINRPNSIATPKVTFYKYLSGSGSTFDYEWYDNRYGNGNTW